MSIVRCKYRKCSDYNSDLCNSCKKNVTTNTGEIRPGSYYECDESVSKATTNIFLVVDDSKFLKVEDAEQLFAKIEDMSNYVKTTDIQEEYLSKTDAKDTYESKTSERLSRMVYISSMQTKS